MSNLKKDGQEALTFLGIVIIIYGILYAVLGTLSYLNSITGVLPIHEQQDILALLLTYIITILSILIGLGSIKKKYSIIQLAGIIFAIIGLISLIYNQITQNFFNNLDCIAIVLGAGICIIAIINERKKRKSNTKIKSNKEKVKLTKTKKENKNIKKIQTKTPRKTK